MALTFLEMCQTVAPDVTLARPTTVIGINRGDAAVFESLGNRTGKSISRRHYWSDLIREDTIVTTAGVADYTLASDFDRWPYCSTQ